MDCCGKYRNSYVVRNIFGLLAVENLDSFFFQELGDLRRSSVRARYVEALALKSSGQSAHTYAADSHKINLYRLRKIDIVHFMPPNCLKSSGHK